MPVPLDMQYVDVPIFNQLVPNEGPKSITAVCDFTTIDSYGLDLTNAVERAVLKACQTLYIDTSEALQPVTFYIPRTQQRIIVPINRQGYFPFLLPNPPVFEVSSQAVGGSKVRFIMLNIPMPCAWWPTA